MWEFEGSNKKTPQIVGGGGIKAADVPGQIFQQANTMRIHGLFDLDAFVLNYCVLHVICQSATFLDAL